MVDYNDSKRLDDLHYEYEIVIDGTHFGVKFKSPHNSIHRTSGFKTEHDAEAWIAETKLLMRTLA